jgi:Tfp pilus assembly protein PilN
MALTHNLLYPKQQAELERKLDPIKIGLLLGLVIVIGLVLFWVVQGAAVDSLEKQRKDLQQTWGRLEDQMEAAKKQQATDEEKLATATALVESVEERFYFAPVLELLLENVPNSAQINSVSMNYNPQADEANIQVAGKVAGKTDQDSRARADALRIRLRDAFRETYGEDVILEMPTLVSAQPVTIRGNRFNTNDFLFTITIPSDEPDEEGDEEQDD